MQENVLLIGFGAIGREVAKRLDGDANARIRQIMVRPGKEDKVIGRVNDGIGVISDIADVTPMPDFVLECASHEAVSEYGPYFLEKGIDFGVVSVGAFSDQALFDRLQEASLKGDAQLCILPGAVGGMDALSAARAEGLDRVNYTSRKPPLSWTGTPAEDVIDLNAVTEATVIYEGSARDAARLYPKNANVAATIALAGAGFAKTEVCLVADPAAGGNIHQVHAEGMFGAVDIEIRGKPLPDNPKTSTLAAHSVVAEIRRRAAPVEIGG